MKKAILHLCVPGILVALLISSSLTAQTPHEIDKSFIVTPGGTLRMEIPFGYISVAGWEADEVHIQATIDGSPRALNRLELRLEQEGDDIIIRMHRRKSSRLFFQGRDEARIRFNINVPYEYNTQINNSAGKVMVDDIDGDVYIRLSAGTVDVKNVFGAIDVSVSAGTINAELLKDPHPVNLSTSTGSIEIKVPEEVAASFEMRTSVGRVESRLEKFSASGSSLRFNYNKGGAMVRAKTSVGSILVRHL